MDKSFSHFLTIILIISIILIFSCLFFPSEEASLSNSAETSNIHREIGNSVPVMNPNDASFKYLWGRYSMNFDVIPQSDQNHQIAINILNNRIVRKNETLNIAEHLLNATGYNNNGVGICDIATVLFRLIIRLGVDAKMKNISFLYNTTHANFQKVYYYGWPGEDNVVWRSPQMGLLFYNDSDADIKILMKKSDNIVYAEIFGTAKMVNHAELEFINRDLDKGQITFKRTIKSPAGSILGTGSFCSRYDDNGFIVPSSYNFFHPTYSRTLKDGTRLNIEMYVSDAGFASKIEEEPSEAEITSSTTSSSEATSTQEPSSSTTTETQTSNGSTVDNTDENNGQNPLNFDGCLPYNGSGTCQDCTLQGEGFYCSYSCPKHNRFGYGNEFNDCSNDAFCCAPDQNETNQQTTSTTSDSTTTSSTEVSETTPTPAPENDDGCFPYSGPGTCPDCKLTGTGFYCAFSCPAGKTMGLGSAYNDCANDAKCCVP